MFVGEEKQEMRRRKNKNTKRVNLFSDVGIAFLHLNNLFFGGWFRFSFFLFFFFPSPPHSRFVPGLAPADILGPN